MYFFNFYFIFFNIPIFISQFNIVLTSLSHLRYYLVSINLNYFYNFGFLLGVSITFQTISGLLLTLIYYTQLQLYSNIYIMTYDFYYGYLYRNIHILLATIVNMLLLIHIFKGLLYNNLSNQIYIHYSGFILYILLIMISYLGYILTYGQLSYWGATVIINLLPVSLATLILGNYNISPITINRYLFFHIILTLILYIFIIIHIFYLHQLSSQSTLPISISTTSSSQLHITFQHFILKDLTSFLLLTTIFISIALFILLNLSHSNNLIPINPLSTPQHIIPEWYFLYLYSILKIIPSKMGGILTVVITLLILLLLTTSSYSYNLYNINNINISTYNSIDTLMIILFSYIYLSYIGLQLPIAPYLMNLRAFLLYLPVPIIILSLLNHLPAHLFMGLVRNFVSIPLNLFTSLSSYISNLFNFNSIISSKYISLISTMPSAGLANYVSLISTTNHKRIGLYYLLTGAYIAILGIILSIIIRLELYSPSNTIINISNISFYNYTISNHGLLMLLFIVMPIVFGSYGNYLLVLSCGLIDIVFPRINNFGYLLLLISYLLIQYSIFTEYLTGSGWTLYPPLSTLTSTYIISTMFIALSISGVSSLLTSVNYLLLIPYILHITDLLIISYLITSLMVLYTIPVLAGGFLLATSDILLSTSYFTSYGDPVLFQHLFWFFGQISIWPIYTVKYIMNDAICWNFILEILIISYITIYYNIRLLIVKIRSIWSYILILVLIAFIVITLVMIPEEYYSYGKMNNQQVTNSLAFYLCSTNSHFLENSYCDLVGTSETLRIVSFLFTLFSNIPFPFIFSSVISKSHSLFNLEDMNSNNSNINSNSKINNKFNSNCKVNSSNNSSNNSNDDKRFNEWLAGIIDGGGNFIISKSGSYSCEIIMYFKDEHTLMSIKNKLGGSIKKRSNCNSYRYRLHNIKGLINLVNRINGNIRTTQRIPEFIKLCSILNIKYISPIPLIINNYWFTGYFDICGNIIAKFNISSPLIIISVSNKHKIDVDPFLIFNGNISYNKSGYGNYIWSISNKSDINNILEYFKLNSLRSHKLSKISLIHKFYKLKLEKAYQQLENSSLYKSWKLLEIKWDKLCS